MVEHIFKTLIVPLINKKYGTSIMIIRFHYVDNPFDMICYCHSIIIIMKFKQLVRLKNDIATKSIWMFEFHEYSILLN